MPSDPNPIDQLRLEQAAPRMRRLFAGASRGAPGYGALEAAGNQESTAASRRSGPPDDRDAQLIARQLRRGLTPTEGIDPEETANALAGTLVSRARAALADLLDSPANRALDLKGAVALEAVVHVRGRPALRVEGDGIEAVDDIKHPDSAVWRVILSSHEGIVADVAGSTGAVVVKDRVAGGAPWVQGTAWAIGGDRFVTNRHVLLPIAPGIRLARRRPGDATAARLKTDLEVSIDLAFDNGPHRDRRLPVTEVLYVAVDNDPVDIAVLRVQPPAGFAMPAKLGLQSAEFDGDRLYVVGHPGRLKQVPADIQTVFGSPDERKRVSFGELMDPDPGNLGDLVHDASTIGGYSGGCVLGMLSREVVGLHYLGDSAKGNRAVLSTALSKHPAAQFF